MPSHAVIGFKPDLNNAPLLDLTKDVIDEGGRIHLVALVPVGTNNDQTQRLQVVRTEVEDVAATLREQGYDVATTVQVSAIGLGTELAKIAENVEADLLVIGMAKRTRVGKALLGSDAQSIMMNATCPVLAVRLD